MARQSHDADSDLVLRFDSVQKTRDTQDTAMSFNIAQGAQPLKDNGLDLLFDVGT